MRNGLESDPGRRDILLSVPNTHTRSHAHTHTHTHIFKHSSFIHQRLCSPLLGPDHPCFFQFECTNAWWCSQRTQLLSVSVVEWPPRIVRSQRKTVPHLTLQTSVRASSVTLTHTGRGLGERREIHGTVLM
jgi:hypothetical protein